jgi:hypothetical protein
MAVRSPIVVVDFEASCLGPHSYPIEAGIARWDGEGRPIRVWSGLIRPIPRWIQHGDWTWESQQVHGIAPADLADAPEPGTIVSGLEALAVGEAHVLCDGGEHDLRWLVRLSQAAGRPGLPFGLADYDEAILDMPYSVYVDVVGELERTPVPHRAGPDAARMVQARVVGLTGRRADVETLSGPG